MGVWIETMIATSNTAKAAVTPCVGVWIETAQEAQILLDSKSHPAWVCGLKLKNIEYSKDKALSHPAWVCGLKPGTKYRISSDWFSHTLRGCVD